MTKQTEPRRDAFAPVNKSVMAGQVARRKPTVQPGSRITLRGTTVHAKADVQQSRKRGAE